MVNYAQSIDGHRSFIQSSLDAVYPFAPNLVQDSGIKEIGQKRSIWADKQPCGNGPASCDAAKHADVRLRSLLNGVGGILEGLSCMRRGGISGAAGGIAVDAEGRQDVMTEMQRPMGNEERRCPMLDTVDAQRGIR
jgi:hypothetical protein